MNVEDLAKIRLAILNNSLMIASEIERILSNSFDLDNIFVALGLLTIAYRTIRKIYRYEKFARYFISRFLELVSRYEIGYIPSKDDFISF